jgi:hypothetical protein
MVDEAENRCVIVGQDESSGALRVCTSGFMRVLVALPMCSVAPFGAWMRMGDLRR